jgi:probable phosphoglycerate mutase
MKVYFVRHGETKYNLLHILMGRRIDETLDKHGVEQAKEIAIQLDHNVDIIFASPMKRAQQTAFIISNELKLSVHTRDELAERDFGKLTGKSWAEVEKLTGTNLQHIEEHLSVDLKKYNVESGSAMKMRLLHFLSDLKKEYPSRFPLVVCHSGIINLMYQIFPATKKIDTKNASIHIFEI